MKRASLVEIRAMLESAIVKADDLIGSLDGEINPQLVEMRNKAKGRKEAFQVCLEACHADYFGLKIFSAKEQP